MLRVRSPHLGPMMCRAGTVESSKVFLIFFAGALPALDGKPLLELVRALRMNGSAVVFDLSDKSQAHYSGVVDYLPYVNLVASSVEAERITGQKEPAEAVAQLYGNENLAGEQVSRGNQ